MIGLLIQENLYEQDLRELLMSFYPGETYAHGVKEGVRFYVQTALLADRVCVGIWDREGNENRCEALPLKVPEGLHGWRLSQYKSREADLTDRLAAKNIIKKLFYEMLMERTGHGLPWGSLTGIRPTKIPLGRLYNGENKAQIYRDMKEAYLASDEKIALAIEIAGREKELLSSLDLRTGYSLYIGIPFCPTTCLYCSFTSYPIEKWKDRTGDYLEALFKELAYVSEVFSGRRLDTVYFGGGTPTSLSPEALERLFGALERLFCVKGALEFSVEAGRPDSITKEKLEVLKAHGVGRISINPQTMNQKTLDLIGRRHTVGMVKEKFYLARELGFDNINMDLIMGLPDEDERDVKTTLDEIRALRPDSLTVHSLAIKRAARLNMFREDYAALKIANTPAMIAMSEACARGMGMEPYYLYRQKNMAGNFENVGYSLPGKACIYNILIMEEMETIAACGAGTTTKVIFPEENRRERCENVKDPAQYIARIDEMIERKHRLFSGMGDGS